MGIGHRTGVFSPSEKARHEVKTGRSAEDALKSLFKVGDQRALAAAVRTQHNNLHPWMSTMSTKHTKILEDHFCS